MPIRTVQAYRAEAHYERDAYAVNNAAPHVAAGAVAAEPVVDAGRLIDELEVDRGGILRGDKRSEDRPDDDDDEDDRAGDCRTMTEEPAVCLL